MPPFLRSLQKSVTVGLASLLNCPSPVSNRDRIVERSATAAESLWDRF